MLEGSRKEPLGLWGWRLCHPTGCWHPRGESPFVGVLGSVASSCTGSSFWEGGGRRLCAWQIPGPLHPYHEIAILGFDLCLSLQAYNIHVNGVLHCRVRYSQLLGLHEQVGSLGAAVGLPVGLLHGALCPCRQGIGSHGVGDRNVWVLQEGSARCCRAGVLGSVLAVGAHMLPGVGTGLAKTPLSVPWHLAQASAHAL